jgi:carbon-monoxide dehydrogenase large subunit
MERILERTARELRVHPVEFRQRNLIRPDEMPYAAGIIYRDGQPLVLDSGNYPEALRRATELIGYQEAKTPGNARRRGRYVGVGFACYLEGTGIGPFEGAAIGVDREGHVTVHTGACSQGQGHATAFAQVCAEALGVDLADVTIVGGDTAGIERGWGTVASRSAVVAGNAVADASIMVRDQALKRAADLLEVAEQDLVFRGGTISVVGAPERNVTFASLAEAAVSEGSTMEATAYFEPPTVTWANGAHATKVEVDVETGQVKILDYVVVHDCGTVINPIIVEGQILGGVAQGIAGALYEELSYSEDGQLLNGTLIDYLVPTAQEIPHVVIDHMETPSPLNPLGVKGVGEGGAVPPPAAIANAVEDALSPFGVVVQRTPLSPAYVRSLLDEAETSRTNQPAS